MTELKLRAVGTGLGIELPQDVLDQLELHEGESLFLDTLSNGHIRLAKNNGPADELMTRIEDYMHEEDA